MTAPPLGMRPIFYLRVAQPDFRVRQGDAVVAGQGELETRPQRVTVDRRYDGHARHFQIPQETLQLLGVLKGLFGVGKFTEVREVTLAEEVFFTTGNDDATDAVGILFLL